jgi:hypothetical protein
MGGITEDFTMLAKRMSFQQNLLKTQNNNNSQAFLKTASKPKMPGSALKESDIKLTLLGSRT